MGKRQKAAAGALGVLTAAGLITGAAIDSPAVLAEEDPIIVMEEEFDESDSKPEQMKKRGLAAARKWILSLPAAVRMLAAIPLWCIGWVVETGVCALVLGPSATILHQIIGWLCMGLILLVVFMTAAKCAFPKYPVRKLLRLRNFLLPFLAAVVLGAADLALPTVWKSYDMATRMVWRVGSACLLAFLCSMELKLQGRRYVTEPALHGRTAVEQEAWRLADTVCPKR